MKHQVIWSDQYEKLKIKRHSLEQSLKIEESNDGDEIKEAVADIYSWLSTCTVEEAGMLESQVQQMKFMVALGLKSGKVAVQTADRNVSSISTEGPLNSEVPLDLIVVPCDDLEARKKCLTQWITTNDHFLSKFKEATTALAVLVDGCKIDLARLELISNQYRLYQESDRLALLYDRISKEFSIKTAEAKAQLAACETVLAARQKVKLIKLQWSETQKNLEAEIIKKLGLADNAFHEKLAIESDKRSQSKAEIQRRKSEYESISEKVMQQRNEAELHRKQVELALAMEQDSIANEKLQEQIEAKQRVAEYKRKIDAELQRRKLEQSRIKDQQNMRLQIKIMEDKPKVENRQQMLENSMKQRQLEAQKRDQMAEKFQRILDKLKQSAESSVKSDPERAIQSTLASVAQSEKEDAIFAKHQGFSDLNVTKDPRWQLTDKLIKLNLLNSDYGRFAVERMPAFGNVRKDTLTSD